MIVTSSLEDLQDLQQRTSHFLVHGYSLNATVSEKGVALQYNSHKDNYDPDNATSGVPVLMGLLYMKNPNETKNNTTGENDEDYVYPRWTKQNHLRVCMQYWDESLKNESNFTVHQVRWILNYTFPMKYANWTPQVAISKQYLNETSIKDWCSRGAFWGGIIESNGQNRSFNEKLAGVNKKADEKDGSDNKDTTDDTDKEKAAGDQDTTSNRRLLNSPPPLETEMLNVAQDHIYSRLKGQVDDTWHRFLQDSSNADAAAQAPKAGDKDPADASDDDIAQQESDAEAIAQASTESTADLPPPLFGIETLKMTSDLDQQVCNVSWKMPFDNNETFMMDFDWQNRDYKIMLNWGVFKDENDTGPKNQSTIYGATYMRDIIDWRLKEPKGAVRTVLLYSAVAALSLLTMINF